MEETAAIILRMTMQVSYRMAKMMDAPLLYVVRHGWTGDDDSYNSPENPHLTKIGWEDANAAAEFLAGMKVGQISASKHYRAMETAQAIGARLNKPVVPDTRLDSWNIGTIADAPSEAEADRMIEHHRANPDKATPGGESLTVLRQRVDPALMEGVSEGMKTGIPPIEIAHHSVQYEVGRVFNGDPESALTKTGGVTVIYLTPQGLRAVPVFRPDGKVKGA